MYCTVKMQGNSKYHACTVTICITFSYVWKKCEKHSRKSHLCHIANVMSNVSTYNFIISYWKQAVVECVTNKNKIYVQNRKWNFQTMTTCTLMQHMQDSRIMSLYFWDMEQNVYLLHNNRLKQNCKHEWCKTFKNSSEKQSSSLSGGNNVI